MGLYNSYMLPLAIDWACKQRPNRAQRAKVVPLAKGHVLEIGIGSGLNLPFYDGEKVKQLLAIDPSHDLWNKNEVDTRGLPFAFEFRKAVAQAIPAENKCFDTVIFTYTLCSLPETTEAFEEIRRVLKTNGQVIFCEHGKAPDTAVQKWQDFIAPLWKKLAGGCTLNKDIPAIIENNGFAINTMDKGYIAGWKPGSFNYWGTARIR